MSPTVLCAIESSQRFSPNPGVCGTICCVETNPWSTAFVILDQDGLPAENQGIPLRQVSDNGFEVGSAIHYRGDTGLDPSFDAAVRDLPLDLARRSDLASVPASLRWFERPHGVHTPAALFHDYLLVYGPDLRVDGEPVRPEQADLLFRYMLKELGVPTIKRYLLWTAVALRTRWATSRASLIVWVVLSVVGLVSFVAAAVGVEFLDWAGGRWVVLAVTGLAPLPASLLWGRERRAALVAAIMAIWILPAGGLAFVALAVYGMLERLVSAVRGGS